jgi:hypothetical protein
MRNFEVRRGEDDDGEDSGGYGADLKQPCGNVYII